MGVEQRELRFRSGGADFVQPRPERRETLGLDCRGVHEAPVGCADAAVRVLNLLLDDSARSLARQVVEHVKHAVGRLVGGDRSVPGPGTVRIFEKVIAGRDAAVHAGGVEAESAILRPARNRRLRGRRSGRKRNQRSAAKYCGCEGQAEQSNHFNPLQAMPISLDKVYQSVKPKPLSVGPTALPTAAAPESPAERGRRIAEHRSRGGHRQDPDGDGP